MDKLEFSQLVTTEIERIEKEQKNIESTIEFLTATNSTEEEINVERNKLKLNAQKLQELKETIGYAANDRIANMPVEELEEYKEAIARKENDKLEEKEKELDELLTDKKFYDDELADLKNNFSSFDEEKKAAAIERGKEINNILNGELSAKIQKVQSEIEEIKSKIITLTTKSTEEVRNELRREINLTVSGNNRTKVVIPASMELVKNIVGDEEKIAQFNKLREELEDAKTKNSYSYYNYNPLYTRLDSLNQVLMNRASEKYIDDKKKIEKTIAAIEEFEKEYYAQVSSPAFDFVMSSSLDELLYEYVILLNVDDKFPRHELEKKIL